MSAELNVTAVPAADILDPVKYVEAMPQVSVDLVTAGAALVHALYHAGWVTLKDLPTPVLRAYAQACIAYGLT